MELGRKGSYLRIRETSEAHTNANAILDKFAYSKLVCTLKDQVYRVSHITRVLIVSIAICDDPNGIELVPQSFDDGAKLFLPLLGHCHHIFLRYPILTRHTIALR